MFDVLADLADEAKINDGIWHHLFTMNDEGEKVLLFADARQAAAENRDPVYPCRALVRSRHATAVKDMNRKVNARAALSARQSKGGGKNSDIIAGQMAESEVKAFSVTLAALENCDSTQLGKVINLSPAENMEMAKQAKFSFLVEQVMNVSNDDALYGVTEDGDAGNGKGGKTPKPAATPAT